MDITVAEEKVLEILKKANPEYLTEESICNRWIGANILSDQKRKLVEQALENLFDQQKIKRDYIDNPQKINEVKGFRYFV